MSSSSLRSDPVTCREVVELVTDYLERALSAADRARFDDHLEDCAECAVFVEQMVTTMRMLRVLARNPSGL